MSFMLSLLLVTGAVHGQLPFHPKFLAGRPEESPFLETQRDALNLHEGDDASVSLAAPIAINCTARGTEFKATLAQKGACFRPHPCFTCQHVTRKSSETLNIGTAKMRRGIFRASVLGRFAAFACRFAVSAGAVVLQCDSGCEDADEASGQWEVYGGPTGPFRMDSRVCKAALIAGIIDRDGGEVRAARTCTHNTNRGNKRTH